MLAPQVSNTDKVFGIIVDEIGVSRDELEGQTEFADLGVDRLLAKSILSRIVEETKIDLPATLFDDYTTIDNLQSHLEESSRTSAKPTKTTVGASKSRSTPPVNPLSIVLQGKLATADKTIFLLPDGSGSAMAYLRLPAVDPGVCLVGLNSPYLNASGEQKFTVEGIAAQWGEEIMRRQPEGPYILGGWSAGGYYSFEATKYLMRQGEEVEKLILIDSPCRLVYEELPMEVVHYLARNNLMGNWGTEKPPAWMVNHFDISIKAISEYVPTPMQSSDLPEVFIIWAKDGVLKDIDLGQAGLDPDIKVTRMLLQRPDSDGALGWDQLFPGTQVSISKMPGNHFTIVYPPNVSCTY